MSEQHPAVWLTVKEYAAEIGVTEGRVRQWIAEGRLPVAAENPYRISAGTPKPAQKKMGAPVRTEKKVRKSR